MKKTSKKNYLMALFLVIIPLVSFAQYQEDQIDPPPAPIDDYVILFVILAILIAGYYFYKKNNNTDISLKNKSIDK